MAGLEKNVQAGLSVKIADYLRSSIGDDNRKVGIVLQGGGMRGVYSAAICSELSKLDLADAIDYAIGTSAGGINAAYFAERHPSYYEAYTEYISNNRFIKLSDKKPKMDLDYMVDRVLKAVYPIDMLRLRSSTTKVEITVTNLFTQNVEYMDPAQVEDIYELFRATAAMPIFYGKSVMIGDTPYIDGGVKDAVPIMRAINKGCTDIVVVLNKVSSKQSSSVFTIATKYVLSRMHPDWPQEVWATMGRDGVVVSEILENIDKIPGRKKPRVLVLKPSNDDLMVGRLTTDLQKLRACAEMGKSDLEAFLQTDIEV
jgi:predicted patatin/cPLA2 family phospholipase